MQWTPAECAAVPVTVSMALWSARRGVPTHDDLVAALNVRRRAKGLPPLTADEAWENQRLADGQMAEAAERVKAGGRPSWEECCRIVAENRRRRADGTATD